MKRFYRFMASRMGALAIGLGVYASTPAFGDSVLPGVEPAPPSPQVKGISEHPLVAGRLKGDAEERRFREFIAAMEAPKKERRSYEDIYREFMEDLGVTHIADWLEQRNPFCHGEGHALGHVVAERVSDLGTAMAVCGDSCTYACIHGAFKKYFMREAGIIDHQHDTPPAVQPWTQPVRSPTERIAADVNAACREDSLVVRDFFRGNCAHGVGHALGMLAQPTVKTATDYCEVFDEISLRYYCETGVFMELRDQIEEDLFPKRIARADEMKAAVDYCVKNSTTPSSCMRFIVKKPRDLAEIGALGDACATLGGKPRRGCFNGLGFLSRDYTAAHPQDIGRVCSRGDLNDQMLCVSGLTFIRKDHERKEEIVQACRYLARPDLQALCVDQTNRHYYQVDNRVLELMFVDSMTHSVMPDPAGSAQHVP